MATSGSPEENLENVENSQTESPSNNSPEPSQSSTATAPPPSGSFSLHNRWLIIGGAGGGVVLLAVIAFVAFTLLADGGPPQPGSLLDMVPEDAVELGIYDFPTIIVDEDFMEAIDVSDVQITVGGDVEELVNVDQVSQRINMRTDPGSPLVILMKGGFVFEDIRDVLDDHSYEDSPYRGYEVWAAANASGAFALLEESGYLISARSEDAVEEALKTLYRGSGSLADAESGNEMKRILDKLGENPVVFASVTDSCTVRRCQGYGFAVTEYDIDGEELTAEVVMLFSSERAAEAAADDYDEVADFIRQTHGYDIADTESDGEFVLGTGTLEAILTSAPPRQAPPPGHQVQTHPTVADFVIAGSELGGGQLKGYGVDVQSLDGFLYRQLLQVGDSPIAGALLPGPAFHVGQHGGQQGAAAAGQVHGLVLTPYLWVGPVLPAAGVEGQAGGDGRGHRAGEEGAVAGLVAHYPIE